MVAKSYAEVVLFSETLRNYKRFQVDQGWRLYGVLVHGEKSGVFLRDESEVEWSEQGCKRQWEKR